MFTNRRRLFALVPAALAATVAPLVLPAWAASAVVALAVIVLALVGMPRRAPGGCNEADRAAAEEELRRAKEAAEASDRAKGQFLANMSHEVRTPLGVIIGYADLLTDPALGPADRLQALGAIRRNARHLLQVVNDVLDLSRIEAGRLPLESLPCDPRQLAGEVVEGFRVAADEKGLTLETVTPPGLPPAVRTDPTRLRQILVNLVGNAVKFTPGGRRARLVVSAEPSSAEGGWLSFAVEDEGVGIAPEQLARLFRPFEQGDASTTRKYGGTGLGLSISRHLAEALGGTLTVCSEPGRGSCFTLRLPYTRASAEDSRVPAAPAPVPRATAPVRLSGRVLLAEDGRDNRQVVSYHLAAAGLTVEVAENGQAAVTKALAAPFDLILMDIQMPELDGYDATRLLRQRGYAGPIVALTAHALPGDEEKCRRAGCTDYLSKPVEPARLLATLAKYLPPAVSDDNGSGERTFRRLVARFADALPGQVRELEAALKAGDRPALSRGAHRLKGAAGMYGFGQLGEVAGLIESAVTEGQDDDLLRDLLAELAREAEAE